MSMDKSTQQYQVQREIFKYMVRALDKLPITANILKKTKIGKIVN